MNFDWNENLYIVDLVYCIRIELTHNFMGLFYLFFVCVRVFAAWNQVDISVIVCHEIWILSARYASVFDVGRKLYVNGIFFYDYILSKKLAWTSNFPIVVLSFFSFHSFHCYYSVTHGSGFGIHLEYDRSVGRKRRHRITTTGYIENLYDRLHRWVFYGQFYLLGRGVQFTSSARLSSISHVYTVGIDCRYVMDFVLDQARSNTSPCYLRCNLIIDTRLVHSPAIWYIYYCV